MSRSSLILAYSFTMQCQQLQLLFDKEPNLAQWLEKAMGSQSLFLRCEPLSGDASFRSYYRLYQDNAVFMLAVAPPATEKNREFVTIAQMLHKSGALVPQVLAASYEFGYILQQDLGDQILQPLLKEQSVADYWYGLAVDQLQVFAAIPMESLTALAVYDDALLKQEMNLLQEWFIPKLLNYVLDNSELELLERAFDYLSASAQAQAQVFVHRDYHCRNLMAVDEKLATIDFQDGVVGPITYDAVSLLKDCYITWPAEWVESTLNTFYEGLVAKQLIGVPWPEFLKSFHLMGLQRHIKVLGIFARLSLRDGKHSYLDDLPTVIRYVSDAAGNDEVLTDFKQWFDKTLLPLCQAQPWWFDDAVIRNEALS